MVERIRMINMNEDLVASIEFIKWPYHTLGYSYLLPHEKISKKDLKFIKKIIKKYLKELKKNINK